MNTQVIPNVPGKCPQCGAPLPSGALAGLCPACLLKEGAAADSGTHPHAKPFEPPSVIEVGRLFPQLEILGFLGKGGMGAVYKARQPVLDRVVALKILPSQGDSETAFAERFSREARALARLSHPNIVAVHEFGQVNGLHFFVMEFVDGVNLRQLQKSGRLSPREALQIVPQICDALQYAHDQNVVHRDIKPENMLVDRKGRVKIADFGLAKILGTDPQDLRLTGEGQVMGTPHYMAPEQVERPLDVDHRADIFSLGVVFYEMLTGELPLGRFAPPSRKVQMDVRLDEVVLQALEKEPQRRYQQANDIKTAVQNITTAQSGATARAADPATAYRLPQWAKGAEFRSKATLFGLPLVHIATGIDSETGKRRVATGIIAVGGVARGFIAIGGLAMGGVAFGGLAIGGLAIGGLGLGLFAFGGLAAALIMAFGGGALGTVAIGGGAGGYWAAGGGAWGVHVLSAARIDPAGWDFFQTWLGFFFRWGFTFGVVLTLAAMLLSVLLPAWVQGRERGGSGISNQLGLGIAIAMLCILPIFYAAPRFDLPDWYLVSGRVVDKESDGPVSFATVAAASAEEKQQIFRKTRTGSNGTFSILLPSPGNLLNVSAPGHEDRQLTFTPGEFSHKHHARVDIKLGSSTESSWAPALDPGEKPNPSKIYDAAKALASSGEYPAALERYLWYWNNALKYDRALTGVRLSFVLSDWVELGNHYPPARKALVDIRDRDTRTFLDGHGTFDLFMDVSSLNNYLKDDNATYELFTKLEKLDPKLAQQCFGVAQPVLFKQGDYALCLRYLGEPKAAFERIRNSWEMTKQSEKRFADIRAESNARIKGNGFVPPPPPKFADRNFVNETRRLIKILVKTGHKKEAEEIRDQALLLLADEKLKSAVEDAEQAAEEP